MKLHLVIAANPQPPFLSTTHLRYNTCFATTHALGRNEIMRLSGLGLVASLVPNLNSSDDGFVLTPLRILGVTLAAGKENTDNGVNPVVTAVRWCNSGRDRSVMDG